MAAYGEVPTNTVEIKPSEYEIDIGILASPPRKLSPKTIVLAAVGALIAVATLVALIESTDAGSSRTSAPATVATTLDVIQCSTSYGESHSSAYYTSPVGFYNNYDATLAPCPLSKPLCEGYKPGIIIGTCTPAPTEPPTPAPTTEFTCTNQYNYVKNSGDIVRYAKQDIYVSQYDSPSAALSYCQARCTEMSCCIGVYFQAQATPAPTPPTTSPAIMGTCSFVKGAPIPPTPPPTPPFDGTCATTMCRVNGMNCPSGTIGVGCGGVCPTSCGSSQCGCSPDTSKPTPFQANAENFNNARELKTGFDTQSQVCLRNNNAVADKPPHSLQCSATSCQRGSYDRGFFCGWGTSKQGCSGSLAGCTPPQGFPGCVRNNQLYGGCDRSNGVSENCPAGSSCNFKGDLCDAGAVNNAWSSYTDSYSQFQCQPGGKLSTYRYRL